MDNNSREDEILDIIQQYEYVPREVLKKLFVKHQSDAAYFKRAMKRLVKNRIISYIEDKDAYCTPLSSEKINENRVKALWVLAQFTNVTQHYYVGKDFIEIVFVADNNIYEVVTLSSRTYRVAIAAINRNTTKLYMPKRIAIVDDEDEANKISDDVLAEINCIALCTVSKSGEIESYDI